MHDLNGWTRVPVATHIEHGSLLYHRLPHWRRATLICVSILNAAHASIVLLTVIRALVTSIAYAALNVRKQFVERINLLALASAGEFQVHEDVLQYPILLIEGINLVADCALEFAIWNVLARHFRKARKAFFAAKLLTRSAFEQLRLNHHTRRAFKILRKLVQHVLRIEVFSNKRYDRCTTHLATLHFFKLLSIKYFQSILKYSLLRL